jgi:probable HAF family extracellular repeat protein
MTLLATSAGTATAGAASTHAILDLGTLGGRQSVAEAVNRHGVVVGQAQTADGVWHGFVWDAVDGMRSLGPGAYPTGIDDNGRIVGYTNVTAWTADAAGDQPVRPLPGLSGGQAHAMAVDATGGVAGDAFDTSAGWRAVRWDAASELTQLGTPGTASFGKAINFRGDVAGSYSTGQDGIYGAFLSTPERVVDLGTLPGASMYAEGMNDDDEVVGWATGGPFVRGFLYQHRTQTLTDLGGFPLRKGTAGLYPQDINNRGDIVGFASNKVAFLKTATGSVTDLNTLLGKRSGWRLERATAINVAGQIVGFAGTPVGTHAFLLTPW